MMKTIAILTLALVVGCNSGPGPETVVQALYDDHKPQSDSGVDLENDAQLARYFSPELAKLFARDRDCQVRTKEICNLGFDPIFAAQDYGNEPLNLEIERLAPNRLQATFTNITRRSQIFEVVETPNGWRISDIVYPEGPTLKEMLSQPVP